MSFILRTLLWRINDDDDDENRRLPLVRNLLLIVV